MKIRLGWSLALCGLVVGCGGDGDTDAGVDAGMSADAGCPEFAQLCVEGDDGCTRPATVECPTTGAPAPEEFDGTCCYRTSNAEATRNAAPELKLNYLEIVAPVGSPLETRTLRAVLNEAMQEETFNWLVRVDGADADGPVTITTGFGRRQTDGTYQFSNGMAPDMATWCPVTLEGTLTGETVTTGALDGAIVVPVFDELDPTMLQVELTLRQLTIEQSTWGEDRSCIGWFVRTLSYVPQGTLSAFIEVEPSREAMINVGTVSTTVCGAVAGSLNDPTGAYCDQPQSEWQTPPDSLCDATGCQANSDCMSDVCDPLTNCNAWHLVAHFAAAGVDITNGACP
jgi:hypothetical protein